MLEHASTGSALEVSLPHKGEGSFRESIQSPLSVKENPMAPLAAKGVFIDNRWRPAASGRTLPMIAPAEGVGVRGDRGGRQRGCRSRGRGGAARLRGGRVGPAQRDGARPAADQTRPPDRGPRRRDHRAGGARHRQADETGARGRGRGRALFRILRRRRRQAARRHDPVPRRLFRRHGLRAQGRDGAYHSRGTIRARCSAAPSPPRSRSATPA